jgi:hypothetical protein
MSVLSFPLFIASNDGLTRLGHAAQFEGGPVKKEYRTMDRKSKGKIRIL